MALENFNSALDVENFLEGARGEQQKGREQPFEFEFEGGKVCSADFIRQFKKLESKLKITLDLISGELYGF